MTINYKDKEIAIKPSLRALMLYENIEGQTYKPQNITDIITYLYCVVVSSSKDYTILFDDFVDYLDENPNVFNDIVKYVQEYSENQNKLKKD